MKTEKLIKRFRNKLKKEGRSLKWWHENYAPDGLKYGYLCRQVSVTDTLQESLERAIVEYTFNLILDERNK